MNLTDQYLEYLRQTKQFDKIDRHFAGYPEEKETHQEGESFLDALYNNKSNNNNQVPENVVIGYVRVFEYPNIPEGKTAMRLCAQCDSYEFEYPDDFDVTDDMRQNLLNLTNGDMTEIADNMFVVNIDDWNNIFSKQWHVSWNYAKDFLCDDNGHVDIRIEPHKSGYSDWPDTKFVAHKCSWKYCKQTGMDSLLSRQYPIFVYIYSADEQFLPDSTPTWLYNILNEVKQKSGGDYIEHMESTFGVTKKFYDELIKHSSCVNYANIDSRDDEETVDDIEYDNNMSAGDDDILDDNMINQMNDDDELWVYIWDGNLENGNMTDYSPSWLYNWLTNVIDDYTEEMESIFAMTVADYKKLKNSVNI